MSALEALYGDQFTSSAQLIKLNYLVYTLVLLSAWLSYLWIFQKELFYVVVLNEFHLFLLQV